MITARLEEFINNEKSTTFENYGLENMKKLMHLLGNPQERIRTIHIAGTNGKGSVAHMLNSIIIESGYKTGLFTSPHLEKINERIIINHQEITDNEINGCLNRIFDIVDSEKDLYPTYFDIMTASAFLFFANQKVDIAVIETGLGGRLDSTNIINPVLTIITSITRDHTNILGESLQDIASEKAGIIKNEIPVLVSEQAEEVSQVLTSTALQKNCEIIGPKQGYTLKEITDCGNFFQYRLCINKNDETSDIELCVNSPVSEQTGNSALAAMAAFLLKKNYQSITNETIRKGIKDTVIPGRFTVLNEHPKVIFDPAHNVSGIRALVTSVQRLFGNNTFFVISFMADKDISELFSVFENHGISFYYYEMADERAFHINEMRKKPAGLKGVLKPGDDLLNILNPGNNVIVFSGTFRLFSLAKKFAESLSE